MFVMAIEAAADPHAEGTSDAREREAGWIRAARRGDPAAFRALVEAHTRPLYLLAYRLVGDAAEAEDLVQESFAKAYLHLDRFDEGFRLSTWLHRIALNTCRDHLKSARRRERASGSDPAPHCADAGASPYDCLAQRERDARVQRALDRLKPSYREVLVLKDLSDLSYQEISVLTEVPVTALKIRVLRARARLRAVLEEEET